MRKDIKIGNVTIGNNHKPFIIAEMSGNHNKSIEKAFEIIDAAAQAGAHAVKLQTYTADTLTIDSSKNDFIINDAKSLWKNRNLYELYEEAHTPWEWHEALFNRCKKNGLLCFSTPFDESSVSFLMDLGVEVFKVASFENNHLPLLKEIARTGKPVIMSTGISSLTDIELAVNTLRGNGCKDLILLKCTSTYPATPQNTNISTIPHMSELFDCHVGLSDHTLGVGVAVSSVALGARVIEKHFTLDRSMGGVDAAFSLEPDEFKTLVQESERAFQSIGKVTYGIMNDEMKSKKFKRSIYVVKDIKKGEKITEKNIRIIRPGMGLSPQYYNILLGKKASKNLKKGTAFTFDFI